MKKLIFLLAIFLLPAVFVNAQSSFVSNQQEFLEALQDEDIDTIVLKNDIETTQKINITRDLYIDGANHTMKYVGTFGSDRSNDNTIWDGVYVLQIYKSTATIKDIKLTGGNAGLLINGSLVTFLGIIDVSGNGFGGIELGQGSNVTEIPKLSLKDDAKIVNKTEATNKPTLWVPEDTTKGVLEINGVDKDIMPKEELSLAKINELFGIQEDNPYTADTITIYLTIEIISIISICFFGFKLYKRDY